MQTVTLDATTLRTDPARFFNQLIKDYVDHSPNNVMPGVPGERIWDEPLIGFAESTEDAAAYLAERLDAPPSKRRARPAPEPSLFPPE